MSSGSLNRLGQEILNHARCVWHKLSDLHQQGKGQPDLRRLSICCAMLLLVVAVFSPVLAVACFILAGVFLAR